jgi:acid phosphatase family membrane protein YuiD
MRDYIVQSRNSFFEIFPDRIPPIFIVLLVGVIIQFVKIVIDSIVEKRFCIDHIFISWWFPSFHTWVVSSVTVLALLADGIRSTSFAISLTFSMLFAYDAMNVRYQTWKHAEYLNAIRKDLQENFLMTQPQQKKSKLKERLWHTPIEVMWGFIFWVVLTFVFYYIRYV